MPRPQLARTLLFRTRRAEERSTRQLAVNRCQLFELSEKAPFGANP